MTNFVHLGIDCGDRGLRVAFVEDDIVRPLRLAPELASSWILFEPNSSSSRIGVGFPSLIRRLGGGTSDDHRMAQIAEERFAGIAATARTATNKQIGVSVLAVPSALGHARREALLACMKSAGLENVSIIDKCTAAAIGNHGDSEQSSTALVFDLDYGDCEYAVVRFAMQRCRVILAGTVPQTSCELLNELLIEAIVIALRNNPRNPIFLGLKQWTPEQWSVFRGVAETARRDLADGEETEVVLLPDLTGLKQPLTIRIFQDGFAASVKPIIDQTTSALQQDFERSELELSDIDAFLVLGEVARLSPAWDMISEAFAGRPQLAPLELVAAGAARYASQLGQETALELTSAGNLDARVKNTQRPAGAVPFKAGRSAAKIAEVVDMQEGSPPAQDVSQPSLEAARQLLKEGRFDDAERLLERVVADAEALGRSIEAERKEATGPSFLLQQARALANAGEFQRAINLSHMAYDQAPNDPDVFEGMIEIHVTSAMKLDRPEEFAQSKKILQCAHGHDQTNRAVHKALAERHYQHAVTMKDISNVDALRAVKVALSFAPKDSDANELLRTLSEAQQ